MCSIKNRRRNLLALSRAEIDWRGFMKTFGCFVGKWFLPGLASIALLSGCSLLPRFHAHLPGNRAFIAYWPPAENSKQLKLAVKDNIDVQGVVTTAGSELLAKTRAPAEKDTLKVLAMAARGPKMSTRRSSDSFCSLTTTL